MSENTKLEVRSDGEEKKEHGPKKNARSAEETLARLKKTGWLALAAVIAVAVVYLIGSHAASKRVDAKYQETIEDYKGQIAKWEDEHEQMIRLYTNVSTEVDLSVLNAKMSEIAELATTQYRYTDAGRFTDGSDFLGISFPFLKKSFTAKWDGVIKAGIDMSKVEFATNEDEKILIVRLPEAKILSHEIISDSIETLDETNNIFSPIKVDDVRKFDAESKAEMEKRALENGLLDQARENAENVIAKMLSQMPSIYKLQFEYIP